MIGATSRLKVSRSPNIEVTRPDAGFDSRSQIAPARQPAASKRPITSRIRAGEFMTGRTWQSAGYQRTRPPASSLMREGKPALQQMRFGTTATRPGSVRRPSSPSRYKKSRSVWSACDLSPLWLRITWVRHVADWVSLDRERAAINRAHSKRWRAIAGPSCRPLVTGSSVAVVSSLKGRFPPCVPPGKTKTTQRNIGWFSLPSKYYCRVLLSCIQKTSLLLGEATSSGMSDLESFGIVRGSFQTLISECPSANDIPPARLW